MVVKAGVGVGSVSSTSSGLGGGVLVLAWGRLEGQADLAGGAWVGVDVGTVGADLNCNLDCPAGYGVGDQLGAGELVLSQCI